MSQRDRLLRRRIPALQVPIRVDFSAESYRAFRAHDDAVQDLRSATFRTADLDGARARVEEARAALAPFQEILRVSPFPPAAYEALLAAHPPTEADPPGSLWHTETFVPALLAACVGRDLPEGERMSEQDWADWIATAGAGVIGDLNPLFRAALQVNNPALEMYVAFR
jgi:hypothetical protein